MKTSGRTFIVAGGYFPLEVGLISRSSGLGLATSQLVVERGGHVAILDVQTPPDGIAGSRVRFWKCDVGDDGRVEKCVTEAIAWSRDEEKPLGGAICCAGIAVAGRVFPFDRKR